MSESNAELLVPAASEGSLNPENLYPDYKALLLVPVLALILSAATIIMLFNLPTPLKINFTPDNREQYQQTGFYGQENDPTGNVYRWTNGQASVVLELRTRYPVTLTISARNAAVAGGPKESTQVYANDVLVGTMEPRQDGDLFFDYSFEFKPPYATVDKETVKIDFKTPGFKPAGDSRNLGFMVKSIHLDTSQMWEPYLKRSGWLDWLILGGVLIFGAGLLLGGRRMAGWLTLPAALLAVQAGYDRGGWPLAVGGLLAFMALGVWLAWRPRPLVGLNSGAIILAGSLVTIAGLAGRLVLLGVVGYPGPHDQAGPPFWLFFGANAVWTGILFGLALLYFPINARSSIWQELVSRLRGTVVRFSNPVLLLYFFGANLLFTSIVYAQQMIVYGNLESLGRRWDSPRYLINAVTLYDVNHPMLNVIPYSKTFHELAFPGFAFIVKGFSVIVGFAASIQLSNLVITALFAFTLYHLLKDFNYCRSPLWISTLALILPEKWLSLHSVGSSEPLAMLGCTGAFYFFKKGQFWRAGLLGALAMSARPTSIFLYAGFLAALAWEAFKVWEAAGFRGLTLPKMIRDFNWGAAFKLSLIPLTLLLIYGFYALRTGDLLSYFHIPEGNLKDINTDYIPFSVLYKGYLETYGQFYAYLLPMAGLALLWRMRQYDVFWVGGVMYFVNIFIVHSEIFRYMMPVVPFLIIIPFARWLEKREMRPVMVIACVMAFFLTFWQLSTGLMDQGIWEALKKFY